MTSKFKKRLGRLSKDRGQSSPVEAQEQVVEPAPVETKASTGDSDDARPQFSKVKRKKVTASSNPFRSGSTSTTKSKPIALPGEVGEIEGYSYRVVREAHPMSYSHGETPLTGIERLTTEQLSLLFLEEIGEVPDLKQWLFLDTETTGLAGGTGTLPFVLGIARWDGEAWVTEQFILERPGRERGMLQVLTERLKDAGVLVTYNGKSYDWPLIRARCVMNRLPEPQLDRHLDLLHVFRRLYGKELEDVRLTTIERERLGFSRVDDLPGSEVPEVYFKYLRTGRPERFAGVIKHNVDDLLAMVGMMSHLESTLSTPEVSLSAWAELALAKMHLRLEGENEALNQLRRALKRGEVGSEAWFKSLELAGALLKRRGAFHEAIRLLEEAEEVSGALDEVTLEGLAKLYEHQAKDYGRAKECALKLVEAYNSPSHAHRLQRIEGKLNRD